MRVPLSLFVAQLLAACSAGPVARSEAAPRPVREVQAFDVLQAGQPLGQVRHLEIEDPRGTLRFYQVENAARQMLGYFDAQGRVYKRVPFRMDEAFLGIYTMEQGLALLFEVEAPLTVRARERDAAEASAPRR
ncbi:MAG: hypothetical protein IT458_12935 [Planctomycetes bacterium]|nr:hypothetical protein [Planctomycetota bacterium]